MPQAKFRKALLETEITVICFKMSASVKLQKRGFLVVAATLCVIYTAHVTLSALYQFQVECQVSATFNPSDRFARKFGLLENFKSEGQFKNKLKTITEPPLKLERTDYFDCEDFDKIPKTTQAIKENTKGNRGISFIKVQINGIVSYAVFKEATKYPLIPANIYKYNTAKREIEFLTKLKGLSGVPHIYGSCVNATTVRYIVERINGYTICNDNGTTENCSKSTFIMGKVADDPDPGLAAIKLALSTAKLFRLLEERHLFFEDISGVNLMVTKEWKLYLADADSLVFYNDSRMFSKLACSADEHCPGPTGNLWVSLSLNARIYTQCREMSGICHLKRCRGFDTMLHSCGMAQWYLCNLSRFFNNVPNIKKQYEKMCVCMKQPLPQHRCSFHEAVQHFETLLNLYTQQT